MNSRMLANGSFLPLKSARRRATVTISVPLAASASRMASGDENFPVPRISRERNSRPAMTRGLNDIRDNLENCGQLSRREPCAPNAKPAGSRDNHLFLKRVDDGGHEF